MVIKYSVGGGEGLNMFKQYTVRSCCTTSMLLCLFNLLVIMGCACNFVLQAIV